MVIFYFDVDLFQAITTIATVIIAVVALFLTVWQAWMTRKHNYNSVRPILTYERHYTPTDDGFGIYLIMKKRDTAM